MYQGGSSTEVRCRNELPDLPCDATAPNQHEVYVAARSKHTGGVNVVFADGHVQFVTNSVNAQTWKDIATVAGNEVVGEY